VITYSANEDVPADVHASHLRLQPEGARFGVKTGSEPLGSVLLPMSGAHNVENALAVYMAARSLGLTAEEIGQGMASFGGVKRRQEERGEPNGILVIDDFAHHPTAVRETIAGIAKRYPGRRLWAIFEPRSNTSRRNIHQDDYAHAFVGAARASIKVPERHDKIPQGEELDVPRLAKELTAQGIPSTAETTVPGLLDEVTRDAKPGDVLLVMSNGSFGGFIDSLLQRLGGKP
jgi:UDP-N-acetylmuramate: L-alanyl-gamma-D-glutamyl-meso-diaminopimelate ligase